MKNAIRIFLELFSKSNNEECFKFLIDQYVAISECDLSSPDGEVS